MRQTIRQQLLFPPTGRVVVAVSGGADSLALLHALRTAATRLRIDVAAAHFNHRLRGVAADEDEEFVRDACRRLGVPLTVERATEVIRGAGLEAAARRARYAFLRSAAADFGAVRIATAHTLDDQAETVLMRLMRGSGADGLRAIRFRRGPIVRPLLECTRAAVLDYLAAADIEFRVDASNEDRRFLRNRVRHDILPVLDAINPRVRGALARGAAVLQAEADLLDRLVRRRLADLSDTNGALSAAGMQRLPVAVRRRVARAWLRRNGVRRPAFEHVETVAALAQAGRGTRAALPGGRFAVRTRDAIALDATLDVDGV